MALHGITYDTLHIMLLCDMHQIVWYARDKLWYGIARQCSLYCLHWRRKGLFIDRPVVIVGHVIHSLCNAEEHHSGAVSLRDRFTKVILKNIIENMNVTRNCVLERNVE